MYFLKKAWKMALLAKKVIFSNFLSCQVVINPLKLSHFQQNRLKKMAVIGHQGPCDN
jgi:hypothetical protein